MSEPKIRGSRKRMLSLWQEKGMFWVSEQRLVDQANTIRRNSWMTELEIEELERKVTGSDSVSKEYIRRLRKVLKSKLNGGNLVHGVNAWAVSLLRYSAAFVSWRKSELEAIDRKTRKLFTIYGALHPKSDVDRLYIPRRRRKRFDIH